MSIRVGLDIRIQVGVCSYKCVIRGSNWKPFAKAVPCYFDVHLFFFLDWVEVSWILLRKHVTDYTALVLHDLGEWQLCAEVQFEAEVDEVVRIQRVQQLAHETYQQVRSSR